jgi:hypothetical protein
MGCIDRISRNSRISRISRIANLKVFLCHPPCAAAI